MILKQENLQLELAWNLHHRVAGGGRLPGVLALCTWVSEQECIHPASLQEAGDLQEQESKDNYLAPGWYNLFKGLVCRHGVSVREKDLVTDLSSSHGVSQKWWVIRARSYGQKESGGLHLSIFIIYAEDFLCPRNWGPSMFGGCLQSGLSLCAFSLIGYIRQIIIVLARVKAREKKEQNIPKQGIS